MQVAQIPAKFNIPFANNASPSLIQYPIPQASQIGVTPGAASLTDGFPPTNFSPITSGGVPPRGVDFNGVLFQSTAWDRWTQAGGPVYYDATFQAAIGGYPNGAVVESLVVPGNYWRSTVDDNTTNPDTGGANWINPPGMMGTGHWQHRPVASTISGWIISNGTTIGNAGSGATQRASSDTFFAFQYLWNNFSNTQCPVSGGRGSTAAADFTALKTIATYNMQGVGVVGVDGMGGTPTGNLNGVPAVIGSVTQPGSIVGANLQGLIIANLPVVTPAGTISVVNGGITISGAANYAFTGTSGSGVGGGGAFGISGVNGLTASQAASSATFSGTSFGSNTPHNNVPLSSLVYWYMKL